MAERLDGDTEFTYAARSGNIEELTRLLAEAGNDDSKRALVNETMTEEPYDTALHIAAEDGNLAVAEFLIRNGATINAMYRGNNNDDDDAFVHQTPLHLAAVNDNLNIVKLLVDNGADINVKDENENTPLHQAITYDAKNTVEYFYARAEGHTRDINILPGYEDRDTPLTLAVASYSFKVATFLIERGADVNGSANGETPLIRLAMNGIRDANLPYGSEDFKTYIKDVIKHKKMIKLLFDNNADINIAHRKITPLDIAARMNTLITVEYLLDLGAKITPGAIKNAHADIKSYLNGPKWTGFTRGDMYKMDAIFDPAGGHASLRNTSMCPVCLEYVERGAACNYMMHDCSTGRYMHKELYNKYKNSEGKISWCTLCGRICRGHSHYQLSRHDGPAPPVMIYDAANPFDFDNEPDPFSYDCRAEGGGGIDEKIMRLHKLREVALALKPQAGKILKTTAMNRLVEAAWLPGYDSQIISNTLRTRKFTIPTEKFPDDAPPPAAAAAPAGVVEPPPGAVEAPTVSDGPGENVISANEDLPVITFRHKNSAGDILDHSPINKRTVIAHIGRAGDHNQFTCFEGGCEGVLWPQEIRTAFAHPAIQESIEKPEQDAVAAYATRFNEYFATHPLPYPAARGGGGGGTSVGGSANNVFQPMDNAMCLAPSALPKGNIRRTTKRRPRATRMKRRAFTAARKRTRHRK